ncbi:MAG TPA: DUF3017 domain-containing protein [Nocardioides sp.]|nr:DUF3017 domain-containing protein [Nocardioides sp.]
MGDRGVGLAQPGWRRTDDARHAARQRRPHGREAGPGLSAKGSALNEEPQVEGEPGEPGDPGEEPPAPRRYPSTIGGGFYLLILATTVAGVIVAGTSDWRTGVRLIGASLAFAAALRLVLRDRDAGMLAVRHRALDVAILVVLSVVLFVLAASIPDQPV